MAKILLLSRGCYVDSSSGAAIASRNMLEGLARTGHEVACFCGTLLDHRRHCHDLSQPSSPLEKNRPGGLDDLLAFANCYVGFASTLAQDVAGVPVFFHQDAAPEMPEPFPQGESSFVRDFKRLVIAMRPDLIFTYGGDDDIRSCVVHAKDMGLPTVLVMHNTTHGRDPLFRLVDRIIAPSRYVADLYCDRLGLDVMVMANVINPSLCVAVSRTPKYVLFVNPSFEKGVAVFARLAYDLGLRRPDIPFLVVESRGTERHVAACGLDLRSNANIFFMQQTDRPADFWALAKLCVMPSLCEEAQGLIAIEAACNGVPIICSDRGALPETVGRAARIQGLPRHLTPATRAAPPSVEVAGWVEAILDLWDDGKAYEELAGYAASEATRWEPEMLIGSYARLVADLLADKQSTDRPPPALSPRSSDDHR